jgi:hypothetical protein
MTKDRQDAAAIEAQTDITEEPLESIIPETLAVEYLLPPDFATRPTT